MTTAHVEKFAELVGKDPALLAKLGLDKVNADAEAASASAAAASASAAAFITNAVKEAKALGIEFTEEEALAYKFNPLDNLAPLAAAKIPIIAVAGDADVVVPMDENISIVESRYRELGGEIQLT